MYPILVAQIYNRSLIGIIATVANACILVFVLWKQVQQGALITWVCIVLLVSLLRSLLNLHFNTSVDTKTNIHRWGQLLVYGLATLGTLWGATAIFLFPAHSVSHQVFIAFVLAGMVAGAVGVFSALLPVFFAFTIPALSPIIVRFFIIGGELHIAMGSMTLLFGILTSLTAIRIHRSTVELVTLQENFADRLDERTIELQDANEKLRQEINERRKAEQALADSERQLNDIIDFLPDPTWVIDINGNVLAWNRAIERITGIEKKGIIGKGDYAFSEPFFDSPRPMLINLTLQRDKRWEKEYVSLVEEKGQLIASESFHPSMGDGGRYFASTASKLFDTQGNVIGAIESMRDITAAKRLGQERETLIVDLQKALTKVKQLSGMLPICSSCKKIRDDKGYWNQLESYIRDRSEAEFSHGICPDCVQRLYPDFDIPDKS